MGILDDAIRDHLELKRRRGADPSEIAREEQEALGPARRTAEPLQPPAGRDAREAPEAEAAAPDPARDEPAARQAPLDERAGGEAALDEPAAAYADDPPAGGPEEAPTALHAPLEAVPEPADEDLAEDDFLAPPDDEDDDVFAGLAEEPEPEPEPAPAPEDPDLDNVGDPAAPAEAEPAPAEDDVRPEDPLIDQPTQQFAAQDVEEATAGRGEDADVVPADEEPDGEDLLEETPEFLEETPEHDRLWFEQKPPRDFDF